MGDFLSQAPLQPLQDNLEMQTYETFEKDLMKYTQYEAAVLEALLDRVSEEEAGTRKIVLMVHSSPACPAAHKHHSSLADYQ